MNRYIVILFASLGLSSAFANINANNGFYIGAGLNSASYIAPDGASFDSTVLPLSLYIRPYVGYRFNDYIALEGGYNDLANDSNAATDTSGPDHYRLYSFDLAAKGIMPFANGISLFGKAGAAITHQDVFNQILPNGVISVDSNTNQVQPLLGVGISYNFTKNTAAELSFTHLFANGNINDINMLGLGITYTFGSDT